MSFATRTRKLASYSKPISYSNRWESLWLSTNHQATHDDKPNTIQDSHFKCDANEENKHIGNPGNENPDLYFADSLQWIEIEVVCFWKEQKK